jgi:hypothetical protein
MPLVSMSHIRAEEPPQQEQGPYAESGNGVDAERGKSVGGVVGVHDEL